MPTSKLIEVFLLTEEIELSPGKILPQGTVGSHCWRHDTSDMFTRVHFQIEGERLVTSGLRLPPSNPKESPFDQETLELWRCFPSESIRYFELGEPPGSAQQEGLTLARELAAKTVPSWGDTN